MNGVLIYLFEASICLALSFFIYRGMMSGLTFFSWNRATLLLILVCSLGIPLMSFEGIGLGQEVISEITLPVFQVGEEVKANSQSWNWKDMLFFLYIGGVILASSRLILGFMLSQKLLGKARFARFDQHWVAIHPEFVPASFFDYILMPDFEPQDPKQRQILAHESMHVRLKHSWDLLLVNLVKVIFWFNPLVYVFEKSLREIHEYQADKGVTSQVSKKEYATLLLQLISGKPGWQFMNNFNQFQTKKRILMLTKTNSKPQQKARFLALIPAVALLITVFSCEITPEQEIEGPTQVEKSQTMGPSNLTARISEGADEVFDITEVQPIPPGGMEGWSSYLMTNLKYPQQARSMGVEGTVIVMFIINPDGSVRDAEILRGIGAGADEESIRIVMESPKWTPAYQNGKAVASRMRLPIRFKLGNSTFSEGEKNTIVDSPSSTNPPKTDEIVVVAGNGFNLKKN